MEKVLILLTVQGVLGGFDNLWHHELKEKLPYKKSARKELMFHTLRELIYAYLFFILAWYECLGLWSVLLVSLLFIEIIITIMDFLEEDRTRKLPPLERVLHTILAINFGLFIALIEPEIVRWYSSPTELVVVNYGIWSWVMTAFSIGVLLWGIRDMFAVINLSGVPKWKKKPIFHENNSNAKTILITGATGFIGQSLCRMLLNKGENLIVLTRQFEKADDLFGPHVKTITNLDKIEIDTKIDAVISLTGAPVVGWLWTKKRKQTLVDSRLNDLKSIKALCARLKNKPDVLINASAIGYYGIRKDELISEKETGQDIFQSQLCQKKENLGLSLEEFGIRVCNLRVGLVFDNDGGAYPQMTRPIKFGFGAIFGKGQQWMSWIYKKDLIRVVLYLLDNENLSGAINATAPEPVTNETVTKKIAAHYKRPVFFKAPAFVLENLLGELSQLFLEGQRVIPEKLLQSGFVFKQNTVDEMLAVIDTKENAETKESIKLYYNKSCPVCNKEISQYKRSASKNNCIIEFNDINKNENILSMYLLEFADIKRRMYVHDENGILVSGIDAFQVIWRSLPGYRWLSHLTSLPVIYHFSDFVYEFILVPCLAFYNNRRVKGKM